MRSLSFLNRTILAGWISCLILLCYTFSATVASNHDKVFESNGSMTSCLFPRDNNALVNPSLLLSTSIIPKFGRYAFMTDPPVILVCNDTTSNAAPPELPPPAAGYRWVRTLVSEEFISGPNSTGTANGASSIDCCGGPRPTQCGTDDTSFGWERQCANTPSTSITSGASFIQAQTFGNIGTCDNNLAGLAVPCNPGVQGTPSGSNWPASTTERRQIELSNWLNQNPVSNVSVGASSGVVWLPTNAELQVLESELDGTGVGADELRLTMIGGNSGSCSDWSITAEFDLRIDVAAYSAIGGLNNGVLVDETITQQLNNIPNAGNSSAYHATDNTFHDAPGCGSFLSTQNSWYFPGGVNQRSYGTAVGQSYDILPQLISDGSPFTVDFESTQSISIMRTGGNSGDARATAGPGMAGTARIVVNYDVWELQEIPEDAGIDSVIILSTESTSCTRRFSPILEDGDVQDDLTSFSNLDITYQVVNPDNSLEGPFPNGTEYEFSLGASQVVWSVVDEDDNQNSCAQYIQVVDSIAPIFQDCPTSTVILDAIAGECEYEVNNGELNFSASDNCQLVGLTNDLNGGTTLDGSVLPVGTTTITWTATDAAGNMTNCTIDVEVRNIDPNTVCGCPDPNCVNVSVQVVPR